MSNTSLEFAVSAIREFSRFYTGRIGVLDEHLLDSEFSLAEARIIYELAQQGAINASRLNQTLGLDPGYLSRLIAGLHRRKLVAKRPSKTDGRQSELALTEKGRKIFTGLDRRSSEQAAK